MNKLSYGIIKGLIEYKHLPMINIEQYQSNLPEDKLIGWKKLRDIIKPKYFSSPQENFSNYEKKLRAEGFIEKKKIAHQDKRKQKRHLIHYRLKRTESNYRRIFIEFYKQKELQLLFKSQYHQDLGEAQVALNFLKLFQELPHQVTEELRSHKKATKKDIKFYVKNVKQSNFWLQTTDMNVHARLFYLYCKNPSKFNNNVKRLLNGLISRGLSSDEVKKMLELSSYVSHSLTANLTPKGYDTIVELRNSMMHEHPKNETEVSTEG